MRQLCIPSGSPLYDLQDSIKYTSWCLREEIFHLHNRLPRLITYSAQPRCDAFLDPLIEHPPLILLLDLVLLKPRVFLHLLFNRGSSPFSANGPNQGGEERKSARRAMVRGDFLWLVTLTVLAETIVRLLPQQYTQAIGPSMIGKKVGQVVVELLVQHLVTLGLALVVLRSKAWYPYQAGGEGEKYGLERDGRQENFT